MKKRFNLNHLLKILFANKSIDKICWMLGFGFFVITMVCYALALTSIISVGKTSGNSASFSLLLNSGLIFISLSFWFGAHASTWLILAFHNKKRLIAKKRTLKFLCLGSLNFLGFYMIDYLMEKFLQNEKTIAEVLLTHEYLLKKTNKIWQGFLIFFAMLSIVGMVPMVFLTCWILSESHYVYLEESTIRDRIALVLESLFCLIPFFSLINFFATMKNKLFIAWLEENAESQFDEVEKKVYWNQSANLIIWISYWLAIFFFLVWFALTMIFLTTHLEGFDWKNFFILFLWPITTTFFLGFIIYKKYLWEMDRAQSLWVLVFEILTLNIFLMGVSLIFIYKNNQVAKDQNYWWKAELDRNFFWLILLNTLLAYFLIILGVILIQVAKHQNQTQMFWWEVNIFLISGALVFFHLVLNIWKMTDYKTYFNNLFFWLIADFFTADFLGLVFNLISKIKKEKLRAELVWI